ncbi:hypothetical protein [Nocardioides ferulae]|uniref:hypothetical protein n=1 Tax=Nocardioides ferulae TaxID=2340821 RepID=UPI000EB014FF|nr:hypothetical protein [Nocardioides ferulae]
MSAPAQPGRPRRVALVPGVLALLPEYASLVDPVADLRAAALGAVGWLAEAGPVEVVADAQGQRVAAHLLAEVGGVATQPLDAGDGPVLVVANGTARRGEKAPGHLDDRARPFDDRLAVALGVPAGAAGAPDPAALATLDESLAGELLVGHVAGLRALGRLLTPERRAEVGYADDPFGVQYWVVRWA